MLVTSKTRLVLSTSLAVMVKFVFGFAVDNHGVNTVPKETLVRIVRAEPGGVGGKGLWKPATQGRSPGAESAEMKRYLAGLMTTST